jgi:VanZ family protein
MAIAFGIAILSLIPGYTLPDTDLQYADLAVHFGMYFSWMMVFYLECRKQFWPVIWRYAKYGLISFTVFGGLMEVVQENLIEGRYGAWSDFWANFVGSSIGLLVIYILKGRMTKQF